MKHKYRSWLDYRATARSRIDSCLKTYLASADSTSTRFIADFKSSVRGRSPFRTGLGYTSWQKEMAIAVQYLQEIQQGKNPGEFVTFSLAQLLYLTGF